MIRVNSQLVIKLLVHYLPLVAVVISTSYTSSNVYLSTHVLFPREQTVFCGIM